MTSRVWVSILVILCTPIVIRGAAHGYERLANWSNPEETGFHEERLVGRDASFVVGPLTSDSSTTLADMAMGRCAYVVVLGATCAASRNNLASLLGHIGADPHPLPPTWMLIFLTLDSLPEQSPISDNNSAWQLVSLRGGDHAAARAGLTATPMHMVLDRNGRILEAQIGAAIWQQRYYQADCSIAAPTSAYVAE